MPIGPNLKWTMKTFLKINPIDASTLKHYLYKMKKPRKTTKTNKYVINVPTTRMVRKYLSTIAWGKKASVINAILEKYIRKTA